MRRCEERLIEILLAMPETAEERCALDALEMNDVARSIRRGLPLIGCLPSLERGKH
jgi:hypothetical protein